MNIKDLCDTIKSAAQSYYEGNPIMTDAAFDELVNKLKVEDPTNELLTTVGWGYVLPKNVKYPHLYGIIGSLSKVHSMSELPKDDFNVVTITPKFDGSTCVAYYSNGKLVKALSRGDGSTGVDKTAKYVQIVKKYNLDISTSFTGAIRGEVVFSHENWNKYKQKYPDAKFPRNISTGLFMSNELSTDLEYIDFIPYKIVGDTSPDVFTYPEMLGVLRSFNFKTTDDRVLWGNMLTSLTDDKCQELFDTFSQQYPIDGLVFNFGVKHLRATGENVFRDIAYKFQAEAKLTQVTDIEWTLSKNNLLIPVLVVDEVVLSGANVTRVTAYNAQYIVDNNIGIGTELMLQRSGEVIPKVVEIVHATKAELPTKCPNCGAPLSWSGVHLCCNNDYCDNIAASALREWIQTIGCRNILGVGDAVLSDFIEYYNIHTVDDIYTKGLIDFNQSEGLTNHQSKLYKQIVMNLFSDTTPSEALQAMNIKGIGKEVSDKIADVIYHLLDDPTKIRNILLSISGIGESLADLVDMKFNIIRNIFKYEIIKPCSRLNCTGSQPFPVIITGSISMPRNQFEAYLKQFNIKLVESVTKAKVLICNAPSTSSKYQTAEKLGIPIMTENEFKERYIHE